jgi:release factor glutamine methyltransferase
MERYNEPLDEVKRSLWVVTTKQRCTGYPLQYILGEWDFYGLRFFVGEGCLVPRSDTETLVDVAIDFLKQKDDAQVLDLCAGSGCIGIAVAANCKGASVTAVEKSDLAFPYLEENIKRNGVNVTAVKGDITEESFGEFDLILSNPPYIKSAVIKTLSSEVRHEPHLALHGGEDGLFFYRAILENWLCRLKNGGMLAVEIGFDQADEVKALFMEAGLKNIGEKRDYGNNQRVIFGTLDII